MKIPKRTRAYRIGAEIQKIVSDFLRKEVQAYYSESLISVTEVRVSDDLRHAGVYVSIHSKDHPDSEIQKAIIKTLPKLRKKVAVSIRLRKLPEFRFFWDDTLNSADRIEQLLSQIHNSQSPPIEESGGNS